MLCNACILKNLPHAELFISYSEILALGLEAYSESWIIYVYSGIFKIVKNDSLTLTFFFSL